MLKSKFTYFIFFISLAFFVSGQSTQEITIDFSKNKSTQSHTVDFPKNTSFTGLSAYILNPNTQANLSFSVKTKQGWQDWVTLEKNTEGETPNRTTFKAPFIETPFTEIRFNSSLNLNEEVTFRLYFPNTEKKSLVNSLKEKNSSNCNCAKPTICERDCWCPNNNCPQDTAPSYTNPTHIILHHSAGNGANTDFAAVVGFYWDFHVNTNGWADIGYNWLIDPNGIIYEGRGDSVSGAHFSCMNSGTNGICLIGNFENEYPTTAAKNALVGLLANQCCLYNIAPLGTSYHPSSQLNLRHIAGHNDGNSSSVGCPKGTLCPGHHFYYQIPDIIDQLIQESCLGSLDIQENMLNKKRLILFPNPAQNQLHIKTNTDESIGEITLYNSLGIPLFYKKIIENTATIEIRNLPKGIYSISQNTLGKQQSTSFIKL